MTRGNSINIQLFDTILIKATKLDELIAKYIRIRCHTHVIMGNEISEILLTEKFIQFKITQNNYILTGKRDSNIPLRKKLLGTEWPIGCTPIWHHQHPLDQNNHPSHPSRPSFSCGHQLRRNLWSMAKEGNYREKQFKSLAKCE